MNAKKLILSLLILGITLTSIPFPAHAGPNIPAEGTWQRKFVRGACNVGLGGFEVVYQINHKDIGFIPGWMSGLFIGIGRTVAREAVGLFEIVTTPFPSSPIMHPEFVWNFPNKSPKEAEVGKSLTEVYPS